MKIIGVTGFKQSGKDLFANPFTAAGYQRAKFAGPLKNMLRTLLRDQGCVDSMVERIMETDLKEEETPYFNGMTSRWAQQSLGTEWGRECMGSDIWASVMERQLRSIMEKEAIPGVILTDMRFTNEVILVKKLGGTTVRVNRAAVTPADLENLHPSERFIPVLDVDYEIGNEGSVELFEGQALRFKLDFDAGTLDVPSVDEVMEQLHAPEVEKLDPPPGDDLDALDRRTAELKRQKFERLANEKPPSEEPPTEEPAPKLAPKDVDTEQSDGEKAARSRVAAAKAKMESGS